MRIFSSSLHVRESGIHGLGVFARDAIQQGQYLGSYEGRCLDQEQIDAIDWDNSLTYLFGLSDGTVIDGSQDGNGFRHLNHSCNPNCEAVERHDDDGRLVLDIVALEALNAGDELCIDYALCIDESHSPLAYRCSCAAVSCRGTMASLA